MNGEHSDFGTVVDMGNGRNGLRLTLLVLPVLLGLVGMHALVAPPPAPATDTGHTAAAPMAAHADHRSAPSASTPLGADDRPTTGHGGHDATHLLHLCLAVLAAVGLVLFSAWLFLGRLALPISIPPARQRARGMPAQRPPPVPRRLAQLCVMRN